MYLDALNMGTAGLGAYEAYLGGISVATGFQVTVANVLQTQGMVVTQSVTRNGNDVVIPEKLNDLTVPS